MNDDAHLSRWLGAHRSAVSGGSPTDHPDIETLTRHATAQLSPGKARIVSEHLLVCEDGRCVGFVRASAEDVDAAAAVLYPAGEAEGMHARTFLCREALWEQFEEMAREQGAPVDELLSDAMRSYARQRSIQSGQSGSVQSQAQYEPTQVAHDYEADGDDELARTGMIRQPTQRMQGNAPAAGRPPPGAANPRPQNVATTRGVAPPHLQPQPRPPAPLPEPPGRVPLQRPFTAPLGQHLPPPPPPGRSGAQRQAPFGPSAGDAGPQPFPQGVAPLRSPPARGMPAPPPRSMPPPLPPSEPMMPAHGYGGGPRGRVATQLTLTYLNRSVDVTKERFIIGRSKSQADLVLDDANVSRQHAAIERVGEQWILADLGSTNGCYVDGQRVSRRPVADGDVIEITTHQVRCTLR